MESPEDILLSRWLEKSISAEELEQLQELYNLHDLSQVLHKQSELDFEVSSSEDLWNQLSAKLESPKVVSPKNSISRFVFLGALLLLIAGLAYYFFVIDKNKDIQIDAPIGKETKHLIADNTEIILSPGSSIRYNNDIWSEQRNVYLSGHAYFDVTKGVTFIVSTDMANVEVLGTQFEVWENGEDMKVSCFEGKVKVSKVNVERIINAGEYVTIDESIISEVRKHDLSTAEFLKDRYYYEKIKLKKLALEIERYYDYVVELDIQDTGVIYSGVLMLKDIDKACSIIANALSLKYDHTPKKIRFYKE